MNYLSAQETAEKIGITLPTLLRWQKSGKGPIPFLKEGVLFYHINEIKKWEKHTECVKNPEGMSSEILSTLEAATILNVSQSTLCVWNRQKKGPKPYKVGRKIFYYLFDVMACKNKGTIRDDKEFEYLDKYGDVQKVRRYEIGISKRHFIGATFKEPCDFSNLPLKDCVFSGAEFVLEVDFSGSDLRNSRFCDCDLGLANFENANLEGVSFLGANVDNANFLNTILM